MKNLFGPHQVDPERTNMLEIEVEIRRICEALTNKQLIMNDHTADEINRLSDRVYKELKNLKKLKWLLANAAAPYIGA